MSEITLSKSEILTSSQGAEPPSLIHEAISWMQAHKTETAMMATAVAATAGIAGIASIALSSGEAEAGVQLIRAGKHSVDLALPNLPRLDDYIAVKAFSELAQTDAVAMDARLALRTPWKLGLDSEASLIRATAQGSVDYVRGESGNAYTSFLRDRFGAYDRGPTSESTLLKSLNNAAASERGRFGT